MQVRTKLRILVLVAAFALVAAACGDDDGTADTTAADTTTTTAAETTTTAPTETTEATTTTVAPTTTSAELVEITVGSIPISLLAPLVYAENEGLFAAEGLTVTLETGAASGAANLTQVLAGDFEIGLSDVPSVMLALQAGLPVQGIAPTNGGGSTAEETYSAVGVPPDSAIAAPADLAGATIATNALNNVSDITIKAALESMGVDSSTVTFVEIPLPEIPAAILEGRVDAGLLLEPFLGLALSQGAQPVLFNYVETVPVGTIAVYFVTQDYAAENPEVIAGFQRAMAEATAYMADNPDEVRALVPTFTPIPEEAAQRMRLPVFDPAVLGPEAIETLNGFMVDLGLLDEAVPAEVVCPGCFG